MPTTTSVRTACDPAVSKEEPRPVVDRLADVVFYGPLGLALEHRKILPQLARRGRRQIAFTRTIGRFTVRHGRERIRGLVDDLTGGPEPDHPETPVASVATIPRIGSDAGADPAPTASAADLAIPQYDSLSAIQVVPRLEGLTEAELTQLRQYEAATRARRTILAKISQLQQ